MSLKNDFPLALVSFLILFLELLMIRYISTEIRIFAYLSNLLLLAIFAGSSVGMMIKKRIDISQTAMGLFWVSVLTTMAYIVRLPQLEFKIFSGITELLVPLSEEHIWGQIGTYSITGMIIGLILAMGVLGLTAWVFVPLGQLMGKYLDSHKNPLWAYSINILASILGMWAFQGLSLLRISPLLGIVLVQILLIVLADSQFKKWLMLIFLGLTIVFTAPKTAYQPYEGPVTYWSPYQKLTLSLIKKQYPFQAGGWFLEVNNVGYMSLLGLSPDKVQSAIKMFIGDNGLSSGDLKYLNQYDLPFYFKKNAKSVLIIGAGGGNDVAGAVRNNVPLIDAVEIDPTIVAIGKKFHSDLPYENKSVNIIVDDGRAYMQRTDKKYDLVIMGLADSQTLGSSMTNLRLDNYLYTVESFRQIKNILNPNGVVFVTFEAQRPWIGARIRRGLAEVYGEDPKVFEVRSDGLFGWGGVVFTVGKERGEMAEILANNAPLNDFVSKNSRIFDGRVRLLTDDWPYLYLDKPRLPLLHLIFSVAIVSGLWMVSKLSGSGSKILGVFFWLGAAFMLFEFQNISKASLLFGTTWVTNLLIITAFLSLALVSNFLVAKKYLPIKLAWAGLFVSLAIQLIIPLTSLNQLSITGRYLIAPLAMSFPILFSGIIFANFFEKSKDKSKAFASNLIGMAAGGACEMFSYLTGVSSMLWLTILFYSLALISARRR